MSTVAGGVTGLWWVVCGWLTGKFWQRLRMGLGATWPALTARSGRRLSVAGVLLLTLSFLGALVTT